MFHVEHSVAIREAELDSSPKQGKTVHLYVASFPPHRPFPPMNSEVSGSGQNSFTLSRFHSFRPPPSSPLSTAQTCSPQRLSLSPNPSNLYS